MKTVTNFVDLDSDVETGVILRVEQILMQETVPDEDSANDADDI